MGNRNSDLYQFLLISAILQYNDPKRNSELHSSLSHYSCWLQEHSDVPVQRLDKQPEIQMQNKNYQWEAETKIDKTPQKKKYKTLAVLQILMRKEVDNSKLRHKMDVGKSSESC